MPPKGFKKPTPTQCTTCGRLLPHVALKGILRQLADVQAELEKQPDLGAAADEVRRHLRMRNLHARCALEAIAEDAPLFCYGHEGAKPGPKPKPVTEPDPSAGVPKQRKKRGPPTLQAVE